MANTYAVQCRSRAPSLSRAQPVLYQKEEAEAHKNKVNMMIIIMILKLAVESIRLAADPQTHPIQTGVEGSGMGKNSWYQRVGL